MNYNLDQLTAQGSYMVPVDPTFIGQYSWYNTPDEVETRRPNSDELQLLIDSLPHRHDVGDYSESRRRYMDDQPYGPDAFTVQTPVNKHNESTFLIVDGDYLEAGDEELHMYQRVNGRWIWTHFLSGTEGFLVKTTESDRVNPW